MLAADSSSSAFSTAGPALGYMAQVDYALLAALERMDEEDDFAVSIETLDDIVFHDAESDDATEKWQSKHTIERARSLSDASTDLWKTLANWITEPSDLFGHGLAIFRYPSEADPPENGTPAGPSGRQLGESVS